MSVGDGRDAGNAAAGRRTISASEAAMPALAVVSEMLGAEASLAGARIAVSMPVTAPAAVLMERLAALGAHLRWAAGEGQPWDADVAAAVTDADGGVSVVGDRADWDAVHHTFDWGDGAGPDLILDGGGAATLLIHLGVAAEGGELGRFAHPEAGEDRILIEAVRRVLDERPGFYGAAATGVIGASVEAGTAGHWLVALDAQKALLFPVVTVDDTVTRIRRRVLIDCGWTEHFLNAPAQANQVTSATLAAHAVALIDLFSGRGARPTRVHGLAGDLGDAVARLHRKFGGKRA